jgi:hypothetical protein
MEIVRLLVLQALANAEFCRATSAEAVAVYHASQCFAPSLVHAVNACAFLQAACVAPHMDRHRAMCVQWRHMEDMYGARPLLDCDLDVPPQPWSESIAALRCWEVNDVEMYEWVSGQRMDFQL